MSIHGSAPQGIAWVALSAEVTRKGSIGFRVTIAATSNARKI
jgi:hypothetical protein